MNSSSISYPHWTQVYGEVKEAPPAALESPEEVAERTISACGDCIVINSKNRGMTVQLHPTCQHTMVSELRLAIAAAIREDRKGGG